MKKHLLAAAALAIFAAPGAASALDTEVERSIRSSGLPLSAELGDVVFTALGVDGRDCLYLAEWTSPYNPNAVELCVLRERRTPTQPSCIDNAFEDITTVVTAGPDAGTVCSGFDTLGISHADITLLAGEFSAAPILQGVAVFPTAIPLIHAIEVA